MGSSRFPGKMMEPLNDHSLMEWVISRAQKSELADETILATTKNPQDNVLVEVANRLNCPVFRGSESDVLGRFAAAAKLHNADIVVRICADRPLVDPRLIDMAVIDYCNNEDTDLSFNHISEGNQYWPRGFGAEVFSAEVLFWMNQNLTSAYHREHVTPYLWENRDQYKITPTSCPPQISPGFADLKLDVDEIEDLQRIRKLCSNLSIFSSAEDIIFAWKSSNQS